MSYWQWTSNYSGFYLAGSRFITHALFWFSYYILFSLIWHRPESGLFASFYLEFILMPVRIMAAYCMLYFLMPGYLDQRQYKQFFLGYGLLILGAGFLQMLFGFFFYEKLLMQSSASFQFALSSWVRNMILINTTVLLLGACKVFLMYIALKEKHQSLLTNLNGNDLNSNDLNNHDLNSNHLSERGLRASTLSNNKFISVKSEKRTHRLNIMDILFIEGMGNYVTYHLSENDKKVVYSSLKEAQKQLPEFFIRLHRSYLINKNAIESFNSDEVFIAGKTIPRGKDVSDAELAP